MWWYMTSNIVRQSTRTCNDGVTTDSSSALAHDLKTTTSRNKQSTKTNYRYRYETQSINRSSRFRVCQSKRVCDSGEEVLPWVQPIRYGVNYRQLRFLPSRIRIFNLCPCADGYAHSNGRVDDRYYVLVAPRCGNKTWYHNNDRRWVHGFA